jgi:putative ABC transport system substrate-binding protein
VTLVNGHKLVAILALGVMLLALTCIAEAQQSAKIPRIGYLGAASSTANLARVQAFRRGLREVGYIEGKDIIVEYRYADEKYDRLPSLVAELVGLKVGIIVSGGSSVTRPAKEATATIPIVMTNDSDPVGDGFVAALARPGLNITGLSNFAPELSGKRLEILKEVVPTLSRVAVLWTSNDAGTKASLEEVESAAGALKVKVQYLDVQAPKDIETAFRAASKERAEGVLVLAGAILVSRRTQIAAFAIKNRLPAIYHRSEFAEDGGLMYYGVNLPDLSRRAAVYVDKILKGAKPADLPVEQPKKFDFIINLEAAKQIGLTIPPNVLVRADKVIR